MRVWPASPRRRPSTCAGSPISLSRDSIKKSWLSSRASWIRSSSIARLGESQDTPATAPVHGMTLSVESAKTLVTKALDSVLIDPRIQPIMRTRRPLSITIHKLGPIAFHDEEVHGIGEAMETKLRGQAVKIAFLPIVAGETIAAFGPPSQGRAMPGGRGLKLSA